ncbi:DoxX family protein [Rahnella contaminans]|uniref:DoxX family protein n=1 Tax=Rahnella contaminans TaxID=2703882 RepID=UPI0023DC131A|nr:DoxX family protein [Rahnella contaminans]MDF1897300.1 DoxX family protein [Rahnella contaminans]
MAVVTKAASERMYLKPVYVPNYLVSVLILLTLCVSIYCGFIIDQLPDYSAYTTVLLFVLSFVISVFVTPKNFTVGFLTSLLPYMIGWRIGAMNDIVLMMAVAPLALIGFIFQFIDCARNDWVHYKDDAWFGNLQWQVAFIQIYFGFNWTGHFTEKLFAGTASFHHLEQVFFNYGLTSNTTTFVIIGGLVELSIAIGIGMGLFTRLAGFGGLAYVMVANFFGGHFFNGYTWNSKPNGGWEYILLMVVFFGSFMLSGSGKFSIDRWLISRDLMPKFLLPLCLTKAGRELYYPKK